jgi:HK97 family phage prohead protease
MKGPEQRTIDVDVEALDTRGRTVVGYAAVYGVPSEPLALLDGAREQIAPGAFADVLDSDVRALLNHDANEVLGRTKSGTLRLSDEQRGLRFELDLPDSPLGENVRSAVKRGDIDGASFRFVVGEEQWDNEVRTVTKVKELHDVTIATYPAYSEASIELRTRNQSKELEVEDEKKDVENTDEDASSEERTTLPKATTTTMRVTDRSEGDAETRTLFAKFQAAGFQPGGGRTEISWNDFETASESRSLTWSGSVDGVSQVLREAYPFGYDQRYAWPAFPRVSVDSGVTSVSVLTQSTRTLPSGGTAVRAIDATSSKPAIGGTVSLVATSLKQVASVSSGVPNVYLQNQGIQGIIGYDLRLAYADGLDFNTCAAINTAGTQTLASDPLLNVIRRSVSVLWSAGYNPDTLILTPANSETIDLLQSGGTVGYPGGYTFGAGQFGPPRIFGMNVRVSKNIGQPVVVDSNAFGKLYASPVSLATFEEGAGLTNSSLVRFEGNAVFGIERLTAACRIT